MELCFSIAGGGSCAIVYSTLLIFFISICLHHQAFYKMFSHLVFELNTMHENRNRKQLMREIVRFHITAKW